MDEETPPRIETAIRIATATGAETEAETAVETAVEAGEIVEEETPIGGGEIGIESQPRNLRDGRNL